MFKNLALLLALTLFATPALACLWDDDTLAQESAGIEDEISVIAGGFPRNPAKYYEMRLERAEAAIKANAEDWAAYDNAGVACDRLGKSDKAIAFMDAKLAAMNASGYKPLEHAQPNHSYRYKANQGTFYVHRWLKKGRDLKNMEDVKKAKKLIAEAIKENPDAHFGREIYQLKALEWILKLGTHEPTYSKYKSPEKFYPDIMGLHKITRPNYKDTKAIAAQDKELDAMMKGLAGLMKMGNAWRSLDVLYAMKSIASLQRKTSVAICITERMKELKAEGMKLMISNTPTEAEKARGIKRRWRMRDAYDMPRQDVKKLYNKAREEVKKWHKARSEYLSTRLAKGLHPDTSKDFWKDFRAGKPEGLKVSLGTKGKPGASKNNGPSEGQNSDGPAKRGTWGKKAKGETPPTNDSPSDEDSNSREEDIEKDAEQKIRKVLKKVREQEKRSR